MDLRIAVLPGDGIGPEISVQGVNVMTAVCEKFGHNVSYEYALCGADAIDKVGDPFPEATYEICRNADAVLFSAVGDPKFDNDPTAKVRPEQGLLAMRKKLGLFANIRPVQTFKCLLHKSPLRPELVEGADFICLPESCRRSSPDKPNTPADEWQTRLPRAPCRALPRGFARRPSMSRARARP